MSLSMEDIQSLSAEVTGCFHTARDPSAWQERSDRYLP
jgi:hypothetical protein